MERESLRCCLSGKTSQKEQANTDWKTKNKFVVTRAEGLEARQNRGGGLRDTNYR